MKNDVIDRVEVQGPPHIVYDEVECTFYQKDADGKLTIVSNGYTTDEEVLGSMRLVALYAIMLIVVFLGCIVGLIAMIKHLLE